MSNLPITTSAPQAAAKPAQTAPAATEDSAVQGQPFNEVLARQVSDAATADDSEQPKTIKAKSADELFAQIKGDEAAAPALPATDAAAANLPAEMLAAMLPQGMPAAEATTAAPAETTGQARAEPATGLPNTAAGLPKAAAAGTTALATTDLGVNQGKRAAAIPGTAAGAGAQVEARKDAAFTTMLDTMTATAAGKLAGADEKTAALAAAPQPNAATLAAMQTTATPLTPANVMPTQVTIDTPVSHDKWGDEFNQKITWLASSKEQSAELHLNPPQLGPMDVVLKVSGDQATALFTSPHAAVREAIEQALPKLREMMAENGIMLGNASVSDQAPRNRQNDGDSRSQNSRVGAAGGIADPVTSGALNMRVSPISRHNGIVDTFA